MSVTTISNERKATGSFLISERQEKRGRERKIEDPFRAKKEMP